jgi:hypothetical protein
MNQHHEVPFTLRMALTGIQYKLRGGVKKDLKKQFVKMRCTTSLGLKQEDEKEKKATKEGCGRRARSELNDNYVEGLVCQDHLSDELASLGD